MCINIFICYIVIIPLGDMLYIIALIYMYYDIFICYIIIIFFADMVYGMSDMMDINVGGQSWQVRDMCDRDDVMQERASWVARHVEH